MQAVGVTTVPARTSAPPRKSKLLLRRRALAEEGNASSSGGKGRSNQAAEQDLEGVDRRGICEDILAGGHVQTFVDFFYLTHRPSPVQGEKRAPKCCTNDGLHFEANRGTSVERTCLSS